MFNRRRTILAALAVLLVVGLFAQAAVAFGEDGTAPGGDGSLLDSLNNQSNSNPDAAKDIAKAKSDASKAGVTVDTSTASSDNTAPTGTGVVGAAIVPPATPLIVDEYTTDPAQLQSGSRFTLTLKVTNPGADNAEDVVVQIGPSAEAASWGTSDVLAVLGSGSAKYVGAIAPGASSDDAQFKLIANPSSAGGLRTVPVKITWKVNGYEHTVTEAVGLLVNSYVALNATFRAPATPAKKEPFRVALDIKNTTGRPVKGVSLAFNGRGATPSDMSTITIGDMAAGMTRSVSTTYTAPLVGRAKLLATVTFIDDFGDQRTVQIEGWAKVVRVNPNANVAENNVLTRMLTMLAALFGLSG